MSIRRIVVPTDFSPPATLAVQYASDLAEALGARLEVLHVCDSDCTQYRLSWTLTGLHVEEVSDEARAATRLERLSSPLQARDLDVHTGLVEAPTVVEGILNSVTPSDLIVLASEAEPNRLPETDSISQSVAHAAPCPVLLVNASASALAPGLRALVPTDLSEASASALRLARNLTAALKGTVEVVHAVADAPEAATWGGEAVEAEDEMPDERRLRYVERFVASAGGEAVPVTLRLVEGPPVEALAEVVREHPPDLVVVGQPTDRPDAPDHLLAALMKAAPCPALRAPQS